MKALERIALPIAALACMLSYGTLGAIAQQPANQGPPAASDITQSPAGDNTKMNEQDRNENSTTAQQQKETPADRELTQHVRQAIMKDKSLSTYAHNVKIISQNGTVTLKGPVRSDDEKRSIEAKADEVAGNGKVINDLTVVPDQK
jgi:hyperosmotically inducible periplasmic protein